MYETCPRKYTNEKQKPKSSFGTIIILYDQELIGAVEVLFGF